MSCVFFIDLLIFMWGVWEYLKEFDYLFVRRIICVNRVDSMYSSWFLENRKKVMLKVLCVKINYYVLRVFFFRFLSWLLK